MKTKRTPQEQYDSLNKTHKRIGRVLLCIMTPWCAFMWVFALLEYRPHVFLCVGSKTGILRR